MKILSKLPSLIYCALTFALAENIPAAESSKPQNIIVILADDFGWGSVGCYGGKGLKTPNLDRLAKEGRMFRHAYATGSVCSPTRYALMTGRYYWRTSVKDGKVLPGNGPLHIETNRVTLASLMKQNGYRTAAVGKWHLGLGTNEKVDWSAPLQPGPRAVGFDYFFGLPANIGNPPPIYVENEKMLERKGGAPDASQNETKKKKKDFAAPADSTEVEVMPTFTKQCVQWINDNKARPFFLYYAPTAIHEPIAPTSKFTGSPFGRYGDFIHELDWSVGQILEVLDKNKIADHTLILFTADNGGVTREQNPNAGGAMKAGLKVNGILRGGKHDIYEGGFREPFLLRWPGKVPANTICDDIISMTDILGTLAGILKTKIPTGNAEDSFDVSSSWFGKTNGARLSSKTQPQRVDQSAAADAPHTAALHPARDHIILQDASGDYAIRQGDWKLIERENAPPIPARNKKVAAAQAKKGTGGRDELYNLAEDPSETKDVAAKHPNIVNRLRKQLAKTRDQGFSPQ